ncbi:hypothetical protein CTI14_00825 [Methylobacterium radiotolerans]|nr:hypothetical protein CTI14_00825 [Methylobacterium radiotolerans]
MYISPLNRVDTTLASAGTGKTTTLVGQLARFLDAGIAPEHILATTFTKMAAEELVERTRAHLIEHGRSEDAPRASRRPEGHDQRRLRALGRGLRVRARSPPGGEVVTDDSAALLFATAAEGTLTRARDHLVLARNARPGAWLSALDVGENPQVVLPSTRDARSWLVASSTGRVSSCLRSRPNRLPSRPPATSF